MRIGCLGAARIVPPALVHPAHIRGDVALQAIAARDKSRADAFAEKYGFCQVFDTYEDVVTSDEIDLIYNPLPINLHAEWSIRALEAGKHVLCEKPFAMNINEAKAMVRAAESSGKRLIEAFHYRYHPVWETLLGWISAGRVGRVETVTARFDAPIPERQGTEIRHLPETGGGAFMDLGCYPLSWALMVLQEAPDGITADAETTARGVDQTLRADLTFPSGARAYLSSSMAMDRPLVISLQIKGSQGEISCINPIAPHRGATIILKTEIGEEIAAIDRITTYTHQLSQVLEAIETGAELPTEGAIILRQQETLDRIYNAAGLGHLREMGRWAGLE